jgi:hypothetical protein
MPKKHQAYFAKIAINYYKPFIFLPKKNKTTTELIPLWFLFEYF